MYSTFGGNGRGARGIGLVFQSSLIPLKAHLTAGQSRLPLICAQFDIGLGIGVFFLKIASYLSLVDTMTAVRNRRVGSVVSLLGHILGSLSCLSRLDALVERLTLVFRRDSLDLLDFCSLF